MKLVRTDNRFNLYKYGFDCYLQFSMDQYAEFNRYKKVCRQVLGEEFYLYGGKPNDGKYQPDAYYTNRGLSSKRIYLRGNRLYTLLLIAMPAESLNSFEL